MSRTLKERIYDYLQTRPTPELIEIWEQNDHREWTNDAFAVIQDILQARVGSVPPQKPVTDFSDGLVEGVPSHDPITRDLLGGLTLIPYGVYALLSALAFAQGWLDWQTNHGPPFLGLVAAWLASRLINRYYRKTYNHAFTTAPSSSADRTTLRTRLFVVLLGLCFIAAWFVDARIHPSLRALPLLLGLFIVGLGIAWIRAKKWPTCYGILHIGIGLLFVISLGLAPLLLGAPTENSYWGLDGVLELALAGTATIIVGVVEHRVFLMRIEMDWKNQFSVKSVPPALDIPSRS